jgi:hypothetical protein
MLLALQWFLKAFELKSTPLLLPKTFYFPFQTILHHNLELFEHYQGF